MQQASIYLILHSLEDPLQHARNQTLRVRVIHARRGGIHVAIQVIVYLARALHGERLPRACLSVRD